VNNRLSDPGFEGGLATVEFSGPASRTTTNPLSDTWACGIQKTGTGIGQLGRVTWTGVPLTLGETHQISVPVARLTGTGGVIVVQVDPGDGTTIDVVTDAVLPADAIYRTLTGSFVAVGAAGSMTVRASAGAAGNAAWTVDDAILAAPFGDPWMARRYPVIQHAVLELAKINGTGGYRTDLKGQVVSDWLLPEESNLLVPPYVVVALHGEEDDGRPEITDTGLCTYPWTLRLKGYLAPSAGLQAVCDLHDDILAVALRMAVSKFNRLVDEVAVGRVQCFPMPTRQEPYGEVSLPIKIVQRFDRGQLLAA
jgi:hypothetical protein